MEIFKVSQIILSQINPTVGNNISGFIGLVRQNNPFYFLETSHSKRFENIYIILFIKESFFYRCFDWWFIHVKNVMYFITLWTYEIPEGYTTG
jgi:hypothetical protein